MADRNFPWSDDKADENFAQIKSLIPEFDEFLSEKENRSSLELLLESAIVDPAPLSFNNFRDQVNRHLRPELVNVLLGSIINNNTSLLEFLDAEESTLSYVQLLASKYSSRLKRAYMEWDMLPLDDWFRINTELVIRSQFTVYLRHSITRNDGTLLNFSGNIPSSFVLADHILKQIQRAIQIVGDEYVLANVNPAKIEEFVEKAQAIASARAELDQKMEKHRLPEEE